MLFADLILPFPLEKLFTYSVPSNLEKEVQEGKRVIVQFGKKRFYTGVIRKLHHQEPKEYKTKNIISVPDASPLVNTYQFELWDWISQYYLCTLGEVYKAALPSGLKIESETSIFFNPGFDDQKNLTEKELLILNVVEKNNTIRTRDISSLTGQTNLITVVNSLVDKGAVFTEEKLKERFRPKTETYVKLNESFKKDEELNAIFDSLKNAPKQLKLLMNYIHHSKILSTPTPEDVSKKKLLEGIDAGIASFNALVKKNILSAYQKETSCLSQDSPATSPINPLNPSQQIAYDEINSLFKTMNTVLLHGITSSGKTEIYIHLINEQIRQGKQVLYLLPEIALTTQIVIRLKKIFGNKVGIYHSKYSDSERIETYKSIQKNNEGSFKVILGVRSSIFLPFSNLGLIIVDEEHENTYKQYDPQPRYHARDSAMVLARIHKAKTLMGTATPSIESYFNATNNKFGLVELTNRYLDTLLPEIILVDTQKAYKQKLMKSHFSSTLLDSITEALNKKKQVILFQNRRGFSPYLECKTCNWVPHCKNCDVSLTYHKNMNKLVCHYCGYNSNVTKNCLACGGQEIETRGFGTEKIEDEVGIFFPKAIIKRLDLDVARSRKSYESIISRFESKEIDILIGTQIISKGLDFENVSTVGILNADNMLNFPDFRAFERGYQLITQVSGRAGRKNDRGRVIIQTSNPYHHILQFVLNNDFMGMYASEIKERKIFKYPPFYRIIKLTLKHKQTGTLNTAAEELSTYLKSVFGNRVLGPEYPIISKIQNLYLKTVLLKIEKEKSLPKAKYLLMEAIQKVSNLQQYKSLQISIDVDPM